MISQSLSELNLEQYLSFVKKLVYDFYQLPDSEEKNHTRKTAYVKVRQVYCYLAMLNRPKATLKEVGKRIGGKNTATVYHSKRKVVDNLTWDKKLRKEIVQLQQLMNAGTGLKDIQLHKELYYINLNTFISCQIDAEKAIIFTGFKTKEIEEILSRINISAPLRKHDKKEIFIVENQERNDGEETNE